MARRPGLIGLALQEVERRAGVAIISEDERKLGEQAFTDLRATWRELDLLGYSVLDYFSGNPSELRPESRRSMAKKSLVVWMNDPQGFRAVELLNDFTFGRGLPRPRARWKPVQRVLDGFFDDPDNKILLTTAEGQRRLGRDLSIQANVFILIFDDGEDGKVKTGLLTHDSVEQVVRDDNSRLRILYYQARERQMVFNYKTDRYEAPPGGQQPKLLYYEHWANPQALRDEGIKFTEPPAGKLGEGKVYQLVENATTEMAFGVPMMQRTLRWLSSYNDYMAARVDMMKAAAAFIMKRKIKGSPNQLAKQATRAISRNSPLAAGIDAPEYPMAGRAAAVINENDLVDHEPMKLDTGASAAQIDASMLHGQVAVGVGWPKHYLGEPDSSNLATSTSLELPVLKQVEARQETFEAMYRALFDAAIQRAVDTGLLDEYAAEEGGEAGIASEVDDAFLQQQAARMVEAGVIAADQAPEAVRALREAYEDQTDDEQSMDRDLSYEFSMPSPLRRMMTDLVTSIQLIAQTFDPNNTNVELSRALLAIALGEALEVDDPAGLVERILPPGYVDPMIEMAQNAQATAQQASSAPAANAPPNLDDTAAGPPAGAGNSYGARMQSQNPEEVAGAQEATLTLRGRDGEPVVAVPLRLRENVADDEMLRATVRGRSVGLDALFETEVGALAAAELERLASAATTNGDH